VDRRSEGDRVERIIDRSMSRLKRTPRLSGWAHADPETRGLPDVVIIETGVRIQVKDIVHAPRSASVE